MTPEQQTPKSFIPDGAQQTAPQGFVPDAAPVAPKPFVPVAGRGSQASPANIPENTKMFKDNAPMLASVIAGLATGGASIPIQAGAAAAAGAGGQLLKDTQWDMPLADRIGHALKEGAGQGVLQGSLGILGKLAAPLEQAAVDMWLRVAKPGESVLKQTPTMLRGGSIIEAKEGLARDVLEQGLGTLRKGNVETARNTLDALDKELAHAVANSTATINRKTIINAINQEQAAIGIGSLEQKKARAALDAVLVEMRQKPLKISVQDAQKIKQRIYAARNYVAGSTDAADAAADKTLGRTLRREIAVAEPETTPINEQLTKQIPIAGVLEKTVHRTGNQSPVGLAQNVAAAKPSVLTGTAALLNHPMTGSFIAQRMHDLAQMLPTTSRTLPTLLRLLAHSLDDEK